MFRTVLLSMRTLLIWSGNLAVFYSHLSPGVGERWDSIAGPIQLVGFVFLLGGTIMYARGGSPADADSEGPMLDVQSASPKRRDSGFSVQSVSDSASIELAIKPGMS